jgi:hypothetical protein
MAYFHRFPQVLIFGLIGAIAATSFTGAIAAYNPRPGRPPKIVTQTGTRDRCNTGALIVTPLEPKNHVAEFGQGRDQAMPIAFTIANPEAATELNLEVDIFRIDPDSQAFVRTLLVRKVAPNRWVAEFNQPFNPGKYMWKLANQCGGSSTPMIISEFEVSALPSVVSRAIAQAKTPEQRSQIYADSGFWYNALAAAMQSQEPKTLNELLAELEKF